MFAVLTTALRIFRFKVIWYVKDIVIMSIVLALSSYIVRIVLKVPWLDMPLAMCAVIVFMRFAIKVKPQYAVILTLSGYAFYIAVQSLIYLIMNLLLDSNAVMLTESQGAYLYLLQIATAGMAIIISYFLSVIGLGFSFIIHPPHSFNTKFSRVSKENTVFYATIATFLILTGSLAFLLSGYEWLAYIIVVINFSLLYYLLHRRSEQD